MRTGKDTVVRAIAQYRMTLWCYRTKCNLGFRKVELRECNMQETIALLLRVFWWNRQNQMLQLGDGTVTFTQKLWERKKQWQSMAFLWCLRADCFYGLSTAIFCSHVQCVVNTLLAEVASGTSCLSVNHGHAEQSTKRIHPFLTTCSISNVSRCYQTICVV